MQSECEKCKRISEGYLVCSDRLVGDKFDIVNYIWRFTCPGCDWVWTDRNSKRDYLGDAEAGPDGMQGRRIGL